MNRFKIENREITGIFADLAEKAVFKSHDWLFCGRGCPVRPARPKVGYFWIAYPAPVVESKKTTSKPLFSFTPTPQAGRSGNPDNGQNSTQYPENTDTFHRQRIARAIFIPHSVNCYISKTAIVTAYRRRSYDVTPGAATSYWSGSAFMKNFTRKLSAGAIGRARKSNPKKSVLIPFPLILQKK